MSADFSEMTADLVSAYVSNNSVRAADIPDLIKSVHVSLTKLVQSEPEPVVEALVPPVSIKKSIQHDYLISMEDGRPYRTLKRHLSTRGLTLEEYRAKWGLPRDYPSVAPAYSEKRSGLAKAIGLGAKARDARDAAKVETYKAEGAKTEPLKKTRSKADAEAKVVPHLKSEQTRRSKTKAPAKASADPTEAA